MRAGRTKAAGTSTSMPGGSLLATASRTCNCMWPSARTACTSACGVMKRLIHVWEAGRIICSVCWDDQHAEANITQVRLWRACNNGPHHRDQVSLCQNGARRLCALSCLVHCAACCGQRQRSKCLGSDVHQPPRGFHLRSTSTCQTSAQGCADGCNSKPGHERKLAARFAGRQLMVAV